MTQHRQLHKGLTSADYAEHLYIKKLGLNKAGVKLILSACIVWGVHPSYVYITISAEPLYLSFQGSWMDFNPGFVSDESIPDVMTTSMYQSNGSSSHHLNGSANGDEAKQVRSSIVL